MAERLTEGQIADRLPQVPGWERRANAIEQRYTFRDFVEAMAFVNRVAELAEAADHHPDIVINYRRVTLTLSTHSAGGVTAKDFDLARQIDRPEGGA